MNPRQSVFELAKEIDQLSYEREEHPDVVASALLLMLKTMLEKADVDTSPLEKACREMGLVDADEYN